MAVETASIVDAATEPAVLCFSEYIDGVRFEVHGTFTNRFGEQVYQVWRDGVPIANVATADLGVRWIERSTRKPHVQWHAAQIEILRAAAIAHAFGLDSAPTDTRQVV